MAKKNADIKASHDGHAEGVNHFGELPDRSVKGFVKHSIHKVLLMLLPQRDIKCAMWEPRGRERAVTSAQFTKIPMIQLVKLVH